MATDKLSSPPALPPVRYIRPQAKQQCYNQYCCVRAQHGQYGILYAFHQAVATDKMPNTINMARYMPVSFCR